MRIVLIILQMLDWMASFVSPLAVLVMMGKFLERREGFLRRVLRYGAAWLMFNNVIYFGDYVNILYALPAVFFMVWLGWRCKGAEWLSVSMLFYTLTATLAATADACNELLYMLPARGRYVLILDFEYLMRGLVLGLTLLAVRRLLPLRRYTISARMWRLIGLLAALPFVGILASVALVSPYYSKNPSTVFGSGMLPIFVMLPLFFFTALALLYTATVLADHERLEQAGHLASLREVYYQGLQKQERQVRRLRHDLRNHISAALGLLEQGDAEEARQYLIKLGDLDALRGARRYCDNEIANVVLSAKASELEREGVHMDFSVSLPSDLPIADTDLCALLGNALDNAREGVRGARQPRVTLRCRFDKGLFMLLVENPVAGDVREDLSTTKPDRTEHGFGIPGMREITERCGGTLEAGVSDGVFRLLVCLPGEGA